MSTITYQGEFPAHDCKTERCRSCRRCTDCAGCRCSEWSPE